MRIFHRKYAPLISDAFYANDLEQLIKVLVPWTYDVVYEDSPFLQEISSYWLIPHDCSLAPRFFKKTFGNWLLRHMGAEDIRAAALASAVVAFRQYPGLDNIDPLSWLSWILPPRTFPFLLKHQSVRRIEPFIEEDWPAEIDEFESFGQESVQARAIINDLCYEGNKKSRWLRNTYRELFF